jgi:type I restriction enzyme S subunit
MSFPRFPRYKDSGVEWLGEVPEGWEVKPLKHVAEFVNGAAFKPSEWTESGYPIVRIQNLNGGEEFNYFDGEIEDRYFVYDGDLLFGWSGNRGTSFGPFIWRHTDVCVLNQHIFRVIPAELYKQELFWTLKAVTAHVEDQAHGIIGMVHITKSDLGAISIPIPPGSDQKSIASFLDRETAKIDALVAQQDNLIALLKEKRQAVISHAVTKGLDPTVPMKDSGVEWLGEVPAHWEVKRLKFLSPSLTVGIVVNPSSYVEEEGLPFVYGGDIREGVIDWANARRISPESSQLNSKTKLQSGDLLTVRVGAPGVTAVVPPECEGGNCASVMLIRKGAFNSEWLSLLMNTRVVRYQVEVVQYGAAQEQFNISHAINFIVPVPPVIEQNSIAANLDTETAKLDTLTAEAQRAIDLLKERRSALISAAVTGKIDVRGLLAMESA